MPIPDFQTLMKPVLASAAQGERAISDVVKDLEQEFQLTNQERHVDGCGVKATCEIFE